MKAGGSHNHYGRTWLRLLPYIMLLVPLAVLNLGFRFLANIELHWQERSQSEIALQELEALTRSSSVEYRLNRAAGQFADKIETLLEKYARKDGPGVTQSAQTADGKTSDDQLKTALKLGAQASLAALFPKYKLHVFRKTSADAGAELFFTRSDKVESKRAMALIFDYLVDQHREKALSAGLKKQRDKLAENYFGKTVRSEAYANSQKGKTSFILHEDQPHWFIWDYHSIKDHGIWGYFVTARIEKDDRSTAQRLALTECSSRGNGLAGFLPLGDISAPGVLFKKLEESQLFKAWRRSKIRPVDKYFAHWLAHGPPPTEQIGNYRVYSYLGKDSDYLTVFLAPVPEARAIPVWMRLLNISVIMLCLLLSLRGLLLNRWLETGLTLRFLLLYFLAATFPLGMLTVTAVAYHYQSSRLAQNQIADDLEGCLRQIETRKMQIQEEYQTTARKLFTNPQLNELIARHGIKAEIVKDKIVTAFQNRENPLPLLGFYLLDVSGNGTGYVEGATEAQLYDIFSVYRAAIVNNLRKKYSAGNAGVTLPEFKVTEQEMFGSQAYSSVTGNDLELEIEKRRNFCLSQRSGEGTANFIYDFLHIEGRTSALLFFAWDDKILFENSIKSAVANFRTSFPQFSFIAFRNTPQGLKTLFKPEDELARQLFSGAARIAESSVARGGTAKEHLNGYSVVAMPFGQNSELVIAGLFNHLRIATEEKNRRQIFILLIAVALIIAGVCAYFTAAFLLSPITRLKSALDRVAGGEYSAPVNSERADELGNLTREFAQMIEGVKERERLATLLSDHAVEALARNTGTAAECDARTFNGIALVSDIRSFTTLCETYPTSAITEMLNHHFAVMAEIIAANGGRIYKFIGDAIEAVFDEDDVATTAERALKAAIEMHAALGESNRNRAGKGQFTYAFGVGLARGKFYAGSVGSEDTRLDYSIIGEHFNRAAQLEATTKHCATLPVAFDREIADLLKNIISTTEIANGGIEAMTLAANDNFSTTISEKYSLAANATPLKQANTVDSAIDSESESFFQKNYKLATLAMFAVFILLTGFGIYTGFALKNQSVAMFNQNRAEKETYRLARQMKSEDAAKIAFETKIVSCIKSIESSLSFAYKPEEADLIAQKVKSLVKEFNAIGIEPRLVMAISNRKRSPEPPQIVFSHGIADDQTGFYRKLSQYCHLYLQNVERDELEKEVELHCGEILGTTKSANFIAYEKVGSSLEINPAGENELFYWNCIRVSDDRAAGALPENNHELVNLPSSRYRIAGVVIFSVPESQIRTNPELLIQGYTEPEYKIALLSDSGKVNSSNGFPERLLPTSSTAGTPASDDYRVEYEQINIGKTPHQLIVARKMPPPLVDMSLVAVLLLLVAAPMIFYVHRSLYAQTTLTRSVQSKLIFSIILTAIIPLLTVAFVSDYFVSENHRAMIHQQRLEIQRYLDAFELRQYFIQSRVTRLIRNLSNDPQIIRLARELDQNPASKEVRAKLRDIFADFFIKINDDDDWASNVTARDALLISRKNWEFSHNINKNQRPDNFAGVLSQIAKHILKRITGDGQADNMSMKDFKSELYFEGAMQSIRSNFGDEAYIKLTNAITQLVEFEITTGAAGLITVPLPNLDNPEYMLIWMFSLSRGSYLTRIAENTLGPFAVFTIEYQKYGKLTSKFASIPAGLA